MFRSIVRCFFGVIFMLSAQVALAQGTGQSGASPSALVGQLMSQFPDGGARLAKQVADLITSDPATLAALITFAKTANQDQRQAIARGLAQAAKGSGNPAFANQIQLAVASAGLPEFSKAYAEAAGDTGTASTGGGGGGGGGPTQNTPNGGQNNGFAGSSGGTNNQTAGFSQSSVGGSSFSTTTTTTNNTPSAN
jgi:hypothetical protein